MASKQYLAGHPGTGKSSRLADHLVIVSDGRTVAEGSPAEVVGSGTLEQVYFGLTRRAAG